MTARRLGLISAASALVIIIVVIGVVLRRVDESHHPTESLASKAPDVSSFKDFPVFWLGDEYEGQKLDRVIEPSPDCFAQPVVLAYGSCGAKFESGCIPPIVIKGCWPGLAVVDDSIQIRGRAVSVSPNLTLEAGSGAVVISADKSVTMAIGRDLVVAHTLAFPQYQTIKQDDPLPGTLSALARPHPRVFPTPSTPDPSTPDPHAAAVFAALDAASSLGSSPPMERRRISSAGFLSGTKTHGSPSHSKELSVICAR